MGEPEGTLGKIRGESPTPSCKNPSTDGEKYRKITSYLEVKGRKLGAMVI